MTISQALIELSARCENDCDGHVEYNPMLPKSCLLLTPRTPRALERGVLGPSSARLPTAGPCRDSLATGSRKMAISPVLIKISSRFKNCWKAQLTRKAAGCVESA